MSNGIIFGVALGAGEEWASWSSVDQGPALYQGSARYFFEHFDAHFAFCYFPQSRDAGLVFALDLGGVALAEHACAISGRQNQLKTVGDLGQTVFNSDACHDVGIQM